MATRRGALRAAGDFVHEELEDDELGLGVAAYDGGGGGGSDGLHGRARGASRGSTARPAMVQKSSDDGREPPFYRPPTRRPSAIARAAAAAAAVVSAGLNATGSHAVRRRGSTTASNVPGKSGVLLEVQGKKTYTRFVDARRKHLSYYKLKRTVGERVLRTNLAARRPEALEYRVDWDRPVARLDLRLFRVQLHEFAMTNHIFILESAHGNGTLTFKARTYTEAKAWVDVLKKEQEVYLDEQRRRSTAMSLGVRPAKQPKPEMPILPTTYGGVELVEAFERNYMKDAAKDLLGAKMERRKGFSILSFNILANFFVVTTKRPEMYAHCDKGCLNWQYRSKRIMRHLATCGADIICLQEVERWVFDEELMLQLGSRGYAGELECNKRRDGSEVPGTATFYKKALFEEAWRERSYRSLVLGLRFLEGTEKGSVLACANSHLEGNPLKSKERASQMRSVFKKLERRKNDHRYVVLCGDYNDGAQSALCQELLAEERFMSCYDNHPARDATCLLVPDDIESADIEALRVDHIFFDSRLRVRGIMSVMNEVWSREGVIELGLPSLAWPSDHLSIAAIMEFNPDSELFLVSSDLEEDTVDPFTVFSSDEIFADEALNPLSEEERAIWLEHEINTFVHSSGRPSPEEIARRKAASAAKEAFLQSLPDEKEAFLRKLTALRRKEAKANQKKNKANQTNGASSGNGSSIPSLNLQKPAGPVAGERPSQRRSSRHRIADQLSRLSAGRRLSATWKSSPLNRASANGSASGPVEEDGDELDADEEESIILDLESNRHVRFAEKVTYESESDNDDDDDSVERPITRQTIRRGSAHPGPPHRRSGTYTGLFPNEDALTSFAVADDEEEDNEEPNEEDEEDDDEEDDEDDEDEEKQDVPW